MRKLANASGEKFVQGMVLYDHDKVVSFGENMFAAPLSCLRGSQCTLQCNNVSRNSRIV